MNPCCRHCYQLTCATRRAVPRHRDIIKAQKIREQLGSSLSMLGVTVTQTLRHQTRGGEWVRRIKPLRIRDSHICTTRADSDTQTNAPAITCDGQTLSFRQLHERTNRMARGLLARGIKLGDFVTIGGRGGRTGHLKIVTGARIAAKAGLMRDVPAGATVCGIPAVPIADFMRQTAILQRLGRKKDGR